MSFFLLLLYVSYLIYDFRFFISFEHSSLLYCLRSILDPAVLSPCDLNYKIMLGTTSNFNNFYWIEQE